VIANIKEIINDEEKRIISITKEHNLNPKLAVIVANDLESSKRYISNKKKETEKLGFICEEYRFKKDSTEEEIIEQIELLNDNNNIHGIIVQLPLYDHLNEFKKRYRWIYL
jgi:methylenetetrahydrofolate dehydrogenase (NADP+)/methenyltetrahydrofolate cyclohydrolase